jgi:hypothetical protein
MERSVLRRRPRRVMRIATALGISAATIPAMLGALAEPSAAATNSGTSSISVQQLVATAECDVGWLAWDLGPYNLGLPGAPTPSPFCDPVPSQLAGL